MKKIIFGKNKIAYDRIGHTGKPKLLMLHGFGANHSFFYPVCENLKKDFDILLPDLPGFGYSDRFKSGEYTIKKYASAIKSLCNYLNFKPFYLVGHSFGGMVSISFAAKFKDDVQKVILQAAPWNYKCIKFNPFHKVLSVAGRSEPFVDFAQKIKHKVNRKVLKQGLKVINKHFLKLDNKTNGIIYDCFRTIDLKAMARMKEMLFNFDLTNEAEKISCPVYYMIGDHDELVDIVKTQVLARKVKNLEYEIISRGIYATHTLYMDFPKIMANKTRKFFLEEAK